MREKKKKKIKKIRILTNKHDINCLFISFKGNCKRFFQIYKFLSRNYEFY
jgi:hypothetical protein